MYKFVLSLQVQRFADVLFFHKPLEESVMNNGISNGPRRNKLSTFPPASRADQILLWRVFFDQAGIDCEVFDLHPPDNNGLFFQLVVIPQGITVVQLLKIAEKMFPIHFPKGVQLDFYHLENERNNSRQGYEIWVHDWVNPDLLYLGCSASEIFKKGIKSITLLECLLFEMMYFAKSGEHLDRDFNTLCAGTRYSNGTVPVVGIHPDTQGIEISWCDANLSYEELSIREVIT